MRPLPEEILADVCWTLDNVVRPALTDHYAIEQAGLASNLLEHIRLRIIAEAALLSADCQDIRRTLRDAHLPSDVLAAAASVPAVATSPIERLREEHSALTALLEDAVNQLEAAAAAGDSSAERSLEEIRRLLRRQLDREREMLGPGYAAGT